MKVFHFLFLFLLPLLLSSLFFIWLSSWDCSWLSHRGCKRSSVSCSSLHLLWPRKNFFYSSIQTLLFLLLTICSSCPFCFLLFLLVDFVAVFSSLLFCSCLVSEFEAFLGLDLAVFLFLFFFLFLFLFLFWFFLVFVFVVVLVLVLVVFLLLLLAVVVVVVVVPVPVPVAASIAVGDVVASGVQLILACPLFAARSCSWSCSCCCLCLRFAALAIACAFGVGFLGPLAFLFILLKLPVKSLSLLLSLL